MHWKVNIEGMHCTGCEEAVKSGMEEEGLKVEEISYKDGFAVVSCKCESESECTCTPLIVKAVESAGYKFKGKTPVSL